MLWLRIENVIPKKKKGAVSIWVWCRWLTTTRAGMCVIFPALMVSRADWGTWFLPGQMAHIFYTACQNLQCNFWLLSRVGFIFSLKKCSHFSQSDNIKSKITNSICKSNKCFNSCWEPLDLLIIPNSFIHESLVGLNILWLSTCEPNTYELNVTCFPSNCLLVIQISCIEKGVLTAFQFLHKTAYLTLLNFKLVSWP